MATGCWLSTLTLRAMLIASEDFPMPGRAAMIDEVARLEPGRELVEVAEPCGQAGVGGLPRLDRLQLEHRVVHQVSEDRRLFLVLAPRDVVDALLGIVGDLVGLALAGVRRRR